MALLGFTRRFSQINANVAHHLRSLKHLAVVDLNFTIMFHRFLVSTQGTREQKREELLEGWKKLLIQVLKDNPSEERKFLKWKFTESIRTRVCEDPAYMPTIVTKNGELEVLPKASIVA